MIGDAVGSGQDGADLDRLLADLAFGEKRWDEASSRYGRLLSEGGSAGRILERAGIAALQSGKLVEATSLLRQATGRADASWRAWNALGVAANQQGDWALAKHAFTQGLALAPTSPELMNNYGWSLILQGRWSEAEAKLSDAFAIDPANRLIGNNLELARFGVAQALPAALPNENPSRYAARLNDAGVVALAQGDRARAQSAFARALEADSHWNLRAANNLQLVETTEGGLPLPPASIAGSADR